MDRPTPLSYCPDFHQRIERLTRLHSRTALDRIFAVMQTPSPAIDAFCRRYCEDFCEYPDPRERLAFWDAHLGSRANVSDDSVPAAYLSECDQGLYGGILGADVRYMAHPDIGWISSMVPPLMEDLSELAGLQVDLDSARLDGPEGPLAWHRYREQLAVMTAGAAGKFGISHFILIDSMNLAFELVGATKAYLALMDRPDLVLAAVDLGYRLNVLVQETLFAAGVQVAGGTCSNMAGWIPGRIVSESVDPWHMTSVEYFERFGREPVERILGHFDGGVMHLHGNGRHLLEAVSSVRGLKALLLGDDRGFKPAVEFVADARLRAPDLPLVVGCDYPTFVRKLDEHSLTGGVLYKVTQVPDADTANRLMELVRAYKA